MSVSPLDTFNTLTSHPCKFEMPILSPVAVACQSHRPHWLLPRQSRQPLLETAAPWVIIVSYLFMNTVDNVNTGDSSALGDVTDVVVYLLQ